MNPRLRNVRATISEHDHHLRWQKLITAALVFLLLTNNSFATTVIVIEAPGGIVYLSSDSLVVEAQTQQAGTGCKIYKTGEMYWAASSNFMAYGYTGFFVGKIVASVGSHGTVEAKMERFIKAVVPPLQQAIADSKNRDPAAYSKYVLSGPVQLQIVFIQRESKGPAWAFGSFTWHKAKGNIVVIPERVKHAVPTKEKPYVLSALGVYDAALGYLADQHFRPGSKIADVPKLIQKAMTVQGAASPDIVGPPYSVLRFDRDGVSWLEKGKCQ